MSHAQVQRPFDDYSDELNIHFRNLPLLSRLARKVLLFVIKLAPEGRLKKQLLAYIPSLQKKTSCRNEPILTIYSLSEKETKQFVDLLEEVLKEVCKRQRECTDIQSTQNDKYLLDQRSGSPLLFDEQSSCEESHTFKVKLEVDNTNSGKLQNDGFHTLSPARHQDSFKTVNSPAISNSSATKTYNISSDDKVKAVSSDENDKMYSLLSETASETDDDVLLVKAKPSSDLFSSYDSESNESNKDSTIISSKTLSVECQESTSDNDVPISRLFRHARHIIYSDESSDSDDIWKPLRKKRVRSRRKRTMAIANFEESHDEFNTTASVKSTPLIQGKRTPVLRIAPILPLGVYKPSQRVNIPVTQSMTTTDQKSLIDLQQVETVQKRGDCVRISSRKSNLQSKQTTSSQLVCLKFQMPSITSLVNRHSSTLHNAHSDDKQVEVPDDIHFPNERITSVTKVKILETIDQDIETKLENGIDQIKEQSYGSDYNITDYLLDDNDQDIMAFFDEWEYTDPETVNEMNRFDSMSCVAADLTEQVENASLSKETKPLDKTQEDTGLEIEETIGKHETKQHETKQVQKSTSIQQPEFKVPAVPTAVSTLDKQRSLSQSFLPSTGAKSVTSVLPNPTLPSQVQTRPFRQLTVDDLLLEVLSWDPNYVTQYGQQNGINSVKPPHNLTRLVQVSDMFLSFQTYLDAFQSLLCLELWEIMTRGLLQKQCKKPLFLAVVTNVHQSADQAISSLCCEGQILFDDSQTWNHIVNGDLVMVTVVKSPLRPIKCPPVLAIVEHVEKHLGSALDTSSMSQCSQPGEENMTVTLKMRQCHWMSKNKETVELKFVESLMTAKRQWLGLIVAYKNLLIKDILCPSCPQHFCSEEAVSKPEMLTTPYNQFNIFNESQSQAIVAATLSSLKVYSLPRICLLQGPPGTGKTHTVIGVLKTILQEGQQNTSGKVRVLLCAPSNGGIDELVRRLIPEIKLCIGRKQVEGPTGHVFSQDTQIVRIGRPSAIHSDVKPFSLDSLVDQRLSQEVAALENQAVTNLRAERENIERQLDEVEKNVMIQKGRRMLSREPQSTVEVSRLEEMKAQLLDRRAHTERQCRQIRGRVKDLQRQRSRIMRDIILQADIVCCTLSGSGSHHLSNILKNRRGVNALPHFSCVVVDEAAQCCELDILIPLQYGSSKLILVGDPQQLPATVFSQKAESFGYGRSLFERFYDCFQRTRDKSPILMLNTQYRMHPAICSFPSKRFYNNRLKSCSSLSETKGWKFRPWLVFNMLKGKEECSVPGAISNLVEAEMVIELCGVISKSVSEFRIGVITPYNHQRRLISGKLKNLGQHEIEVNTVDGFQGREKDVILLSCVRARQTAGGIGFLSHRQRLNVSLTRAKKTLVVIGHLESLQVNADWQALFNDATERHVVVDVDDTNYSEAAKALLLSGKLNPREHSGLQVRPIDSTKHPSVAAVKPQQHSQSDQENTAVPVSQQRNFNKEPQKENSKILHSHDPVTTTDLKDAPVKQSSTDSCSPVKSKELSSVRSTAKKPAHKVDIQRKTLCEVLKERFTDDLDNPSVSPSFRPHSDIEKSSSLKQRHGLSLADTSKSVFYQAVTHSSTAQNKSSAQTQKLQHTCQLNVPRVKPPKQRVSIPLTNSDQATVKSLSTGWCSLIPPIEKRYNSASKSDTKSTKLRTFRSRPANKRLSTLNAPKQLPKRTKRSEKSTNSFGNRPTIESTYEGKGYTVLLKPHERVAHAQAATASKRKAFLHSNYYPRPKQPTIVDSASTAQSREIQGTPKQTGHSATNRSSTDVLGSIISDMRKDPSYG
ncbi:uncharacterized protein LOC134184168 isoform X2 [Corticium candelabrum]|uniref:uncharacterized protein LOC134184168 isoform X2 n=1 Tax=Corticium candelabrum TaxID=121492 RepID=UPI002E3237C3|nr:uncharacterized protein LOC134184168 isoform X2 [Corticium candelabrum]